MSSRVASRSVKVHLARGSARRRSRPRARVAKYLEITRRAEVLNKRLDIVNDLLDSLCAQLETRNAHRLELIIIYLIALEIILELAKEVTLPAMLGGVGAWPRRLLMLGWRAVFRGGGPPPVAWAALPFLGPGVRRLRWPWQWHWLKN